MEKFEGRRCVLCGMERLSTSMAAADNEALCCADCLARGCWEGNPEQALVRAMAETLRQQTTALKQALRAAGVKI